MTCTVYSLFTHCKPSYSDLHRHHWWQFYKELTHKTLSALVNYLEHSYKNHCFMWRKSWEQINSWINVLWKLEVSSIYWSSLKDNAHKHYKWEHCVVPGQFWRLTPCAQYCLSLNWCTRLKKNHFSLLYGQLLNLLGVRLLTRNSVYLSELKLCFISSGHIHCLLTDRYLCVCRSWFKFNMYLELGLLGDSSDLSGQLQLFPDRVLLLGLQTVPKVIWGNTQKKNILFTTGSMELC